MGAADRVEQRGAAPVKGRGDLFDALFQALAQGGELVAEALGQLLLLGAGVGQEFGLRLRGAALQLPLLFGQRAQQAAGVLFEVPGVGIEAGLLGGLLAGGQRERGDGVNRFIGCGC